MRTAAWTQSVSVLDRLSAVLDAFGDDGEGLTITQIAQRANLPKSTVSRIAADLVDEGYLDRDEATLFLGIRLFEFGQSVERPRRLRDLARPAMKRLRDATGLSVRIAVADADGLVVVAGMRGRDDLAPARAGERLPREGTALWRAFEAFSRDQDAAASHTADHGAHVCVASPVVERRSVVAALAISGRTAGVDAAALAPLVASAATAIGRRLSETP